MEVINFKNNKLYLLDQRVLPEKEEYFQVAASHEAAAAITDMVVRGAPAIGIAAAYGYALGALEKNIKSYDELKKHMDSVRQELLKARPTAVNLKWAVNKMHGEFKQLEGKELSEVRDKLVAAADKIKKKEIEANIKMGEYGANLIEKIYKEKGKINILTHCNAGALATGGWGTALGVIRSAAERGYVQMVYADETRPRLQGAKLTCYELKKAEIPYTLISDNMSGFLMNRGKIDCAVVGADRIARNGDVANKIGTYMVAALAQRHSIPFYVAAPESTFDFDTADGSGIEIEERSHDEVLLINDRSIAPEGTETVNPAFDVTPKELVSAYITEKGVIGSPDEL